ncbi:hypothetical protein GEMRC1_010408 [Eukaryota sp. GEM-RC1]
MLGSSTSLRQKVSPYFSGFLFAIGIWLFIDAIAYSRHISSEFPEQPPIRFFFWIPLFLSLTAFFGLCLLDVSKLKGDSFGEGAKMTRYGLFLILLLAFSSLFVAVWILIEQYMPENNEKEIDSFPGLANVLHVFVVLLSSLVLAVGRTETDNW